MISLAGSEVGYYRCLLSYEARGLISISSRFQSFGYRGLDLGGLFLLVLGKRRSSWGGVNAGTHGSPGCVPAPAAANEACLRVMDGGGDAAAAAGGSSWGGERY